MPRSIPITLWLTAAAILAYCSPGVADALHYDRALVNQGELWRILTCHLTHWSTDHMLWDVVMFAALGLLCELRNRRSFLACMIVSACLIPAAVWLLLPVIETYRGLSGIDTALFTLFAVTELREKWGQRRWSWAAAIGLLLSASVGKLGFEIITGEVLFVDAHTANFVPLPLVHIVGALAGTAFGIACQIAESPTASPLFASPENGREFRSRTGPIASCRSVWPARPLR